MKKSIPTILALLITAALFSILFQPDEPGASGMEPIIRVWLVDAEKDSAAFLRKCAAAYEKQTGKRIYLRSATRKEAAGAAENAGNIVPPDLIVGLESGEKILCEGYALLFRDDSAPVFTPSPTSLLFSPPTPTPGPSPTPAPTCALSSYAGILCPRKMSDRFPGSIVSDQPAQDFIAGKGTAALLTARQASSLSIGWQSQIPPDGEGVCFLYARALSPQGENLLSFLQSDEAQRKLREYDLHSPFLLLYTHENSLQGMIDRSILR